MVLAAPYAHVEAVPPPYMHAKGVAKVLLVHCWMYSCTLAHIEPVPWYVSEAASPSVQLPEYTLSVVAARLPEFSNVRLAVEASPGLRRVRLKRPSQAALTFVSVAPPAVERHAPLPPLFVFDSTSVPDANLFVGFFVSAVNVATLAVAVYPHRARSTVRVIRIRVRIGPRLAKPASRPGVVVGGPATSPDGEARGFASPGHPGFA